jgi:hypothetical protein
LHEFPLFPSFSDLAMAAWPYGNRQALDARRIARRAQLTFGQLHFWGATPAANFNSQSNWTRPVART